MVWQPAETKTQLRRRMRKHALMCMKTVVAEIKTHRCRSRKEAVTCPSCQLFIAVNNYEIDVEPSLVDSSVGTWKHHGTEGAEPSRIESNVGMADLGGDPADEHYEEFVYDAEYFEPCAELDVLDLPEVQHLLSRKERAQQKKNAHRRERQRVELGSKRNVVETSRHGFEDDEEKAVLEEEGKSSHEEIPLARNQSHDKKARGEKDADAVRDDHDKAMAVEDSESSPGKISLARNHVHDKKAREEEAKGGKEDQNEKAEVEHDAIKSPAEDGGEEKRDEGVELGIVDSCSNVETAKHLETRRSEEVSLARHHTYVKKVREKKDADESEFDHYNTVAEQEGKSSHEKSSLARDHIDDDKAREEEAKGGRSQRKKPKKAREKERAEVEAGTNKNPAEKERKEDDKSAETVKRFDGKSSGCGIRFKNCPMFGHSLVVGSWKQQLHERSQAFATETKSEAKSSRNDGPKPEIKERWWGSTLAQQFFRWLDEPELSKNQRRKAKKKEKKLKAG